MWADTELKSSLQISSSAETIQSQISGLKIYQDIGLTSNQALSFLVPETLWYHFINTNPARDLENPPMLTVPRLWIQIPAFPGFIYAKAKILSQLACCGPFHPIEHSHINPYLVLAIGPSIHGPSQDLLLRGLDTG